MTASLSQYKLSNFFVDQRIKVLENEYGGGCKSQNAAKAIQSIFREYMLKKQFLKLREINRRKKWNVVNLPKSKDDGIGSSSSSKDSDENCQLNADITTETDQCMPEVLENNEQILNSILQEYLTDASFINSENKKISPRTNDVASKSNAEDFYEESLSYKNAQDNKSNLEITALSSNKTRSSLDGDRSSEVQEDKIKPTIVGELEKKNVSPIFFLNSVIDNQCPKARKLMYKTGLNLFNKNPERGIRYLVDNGFLVQKPFAISKFFLTRTGISKQMIGEYLGEINKSFNNQVLINFTNRINISNMELDLALRKYQSFFRMPGEAQKIEKLMEVFSNHYCRSNVNVCSQFKSLDTIFLLSFAIIMLNTDLHNPNIKPKKRMKVRDFIKNLDGLDGGWNIDEEILVQIYDNILKEPLKPAVDHTSLVMKIETLIMDKKPRLVLPFRRLVCFCRLFEIKDLNKKDNLAAHQREVFLFNDSILILKLHNRKKSLSYKFKELILLAGVQILIFNNNYYKFGVMLKPNISDVPLAVFNARNSSDQMNLVNDLREVIAESDEMERLRIREELEKHRFIKKTHNTALMNHLHVEHPRSMEWDQTTIAADHSTVPKFFRLSDIESQKFKHCSSHSLGDLQKSSSR